MSFTLRMGIPEMEGLWKDLLAKHESGALKGPDKLLFKKMVKISLKVEDNVNEKFIWLLKHFSPGEISIVEIDEYLSDDDYLRSQEGMVDSTKEARSEPLENGVTLQHLDW